MRWIIRRPVVCIPIQALSIGRGYQHVSRRLTGIVQRFYERVWRRQMFDDIRADYDSILEQFRGNNFLVQVEAVPLASRRDISAVVDIRTIVDTDNLKFP